MTKILLVNPPIENRVKASINSFIDSFSDNTPMPPLGLMYLASYLEKHNHDVEICDMAVGDYLSQYLMEWRVSELPEYVGITCTTLTFFDALEVAKSIKAYHKDIKIVMGGANCTIYPEEVATHPAIDYIVQGEGELPFRDIIEGIADRICHPCKSGMKNLSTIPDYGMVNISRYTSPLAKKQSYSMVSSRNCPYRCSFCYQPRHEEKFRAYSAEQLSKEFISKFSNKECEVEIYDDTFTYDVNRVAEFCDVLISAKKSGNQLPNWNIRTRVDKVNKELLKIMKQAGCQRINFGIESYNEDVLQTLRKGIRVRDIDSAVEDTKSTGIEIQAYFMLGSPNETSNQMMETINFANKAPIDYAYYSITSPMPKTALYEQGLRDGKYNDYWREHVLNPQKDMKMMFWDEERREELVEMMEYAYRSFYLRPGYVLKQLVKTRSMDEIKRKAEMAIKMIKGGSKTQ